MSIDTKELRRMLAEATPGEWYRELHPDGDSIDGPNGSDVESCDIAHEGERIARAEWGPDAAAIVALHNAAPALLDAAEEAERLRATVDAQTAIIVDIKVEKAGLEVDVERLRAFVPVWRMKRYSPSAVTWRLFIGTTAIPDTGLHPIDDGRVFASGDGEGYPDIATAARAVCTALGIPYVPIEPAVGGEVKP